ncbi:hypothetical protein QBC34DRAFT_380128 [Podospora aff. communis PSN243]|uniref:Uncharacterized protein n=1 Tax=Podospora aff. communis PSN243 TaxID=3040156 RepID=A0AAV9GPS4_9PEZI|nr:hypothetical protein QBC34DRAFT_380128 [Podospora aff. communis PSN243]
MSITILVQSAIPPSSPLPQKTFKTWYETVHIPDLLALPDRKVPAAARYVRSDTDELHPSDSKSGFPFLAIYPNLSAEWLRSESCEFLKVPLHSEILPRGEKGEEGYILDMLDIEMGGYEVVLSVILGGVVGEARCVVVVPVGEETVKEMGEDEDDGASVVLESAKMMGVQGNVQSVIMRYEYSPMGAGSKEEEGKEGLFVGGKYLVLHQLESPPTEVGEQWGEKPLVYTLIRNFGDVKGALLV